MKLFKQFFTYNNMKKEDKGFLDIIIRYLILVGISIVGIGIFYKLFLPITLYPSYWAIDLFYSPILYGDTIFVGIESIQIIGACVAGSAYLFLLILNLATPKVKAMTRLKLTLFSFGTFLLINLLRIILLSYMFLGNSGNFEFFHELFWYLGSTLFVVVIWFVGVNHYKIYEIPFYSDLKFMAKKSVFGKYFKK